MRIKEMEQELNKLSKKELMRFCINEIGGRYCDDLGSLKFRVEKTLKHIKDEELLKINEELLKINEELLKINEECDDAYKEMLEAQKMYTTQEYLDLEAKLKILQTEPYVKTCYKDILDHNKKINKVLDAIIALKKPLTTAKRKYLDLYKKRWELYKC